MHFPRAAFGLAIAITLPGVLSQVVTITQRPSACSAIYTTGLSSVTVVQSTVTVAPVPFSDTLVNGGTPFVIEIQPDTAARRRQTESSTYIDSNGRTTTNASEAALYKIINGTLQGIAGGYVSADVSSGSISFALSDFVKAISTTFFSRDLGIGWNNTAFDGGSANFYTTAAGDGTLDVISLLKGVADPSWLAVKFAAKAVTGLLLDPSVSTSVSTYYISTGDSAPTYPAVAISTVETSAPTPTGNPTPNGYCGVSAGICDGAVYGTCCSQYGACGNTDEYCGAGCQSAFGVCNPVIASSSVVADASSAGPSAPVYSATAPQPATSAPAVSSDAPPVYPTVYSSTSIFVSTSGSVLMTMTTMVPVTTSLPIYSDPGTPIGPINPPVPSTSAAVSSSIPAMSSDVLPPSYPVTPSSPAATVTVVPIPSYSAASISIPAVISSIIAPPSYQSTVGPGTGAGSGAPSYSAAPSSPIVSISSVPVVGPSSSPIVSAISSVPVVAPSSASIPILSVSSLHLSISSIPISAVLPSAYSTPIASSVSVVVPPVYSTTVVPAVSTTHISSAALPILSTSTIRTSSSALASPVASGPTCPGAADGSTTTDSSGQSYAIYCNSDYSGAGASLPNIATFDACLLKCDTTAGCGAATYVATSKYCYLHPAGGYLTGTGGYVGVRVSAPLVGTSSPAAAMSTAVPVLLSTTSIPAIFSSTPIPGPVFSTTSIPAPVYSSSPQATPTGIITSNGYCGPTNGGAICGLNFGNCCSQYGSCGNTTDYCGAGCNPQYGVCASSSSTAIVSTIAPPVYSSSIPPPVYSSTAIPTTTTSSSATSSSNPDLVLTAPIRCDFGDPVGYGEDDSYCQVTLPQPMVLYSKSSVNTYPSTNGILSIISGTSQFQNAETLPTDQVTEADNTTPLTALFPFWDDLAIPDFTGASDYGIYYQLSDTGVMYEYYLTRPGQEIVFHFTVGYTYSTPGVATFTYYALDDPGTYSTVGSQGCKFLSCSLFSMNHEAD